MEAAIEHNGDTDPSHDDAYDDGIGLSYDAECNEHITASEVILQLNSVTMTKAMLRLDSHYSHERLGDDEINDVSLAVNHRLYEMLTNEFSLDEIVCEHVMAALDDGNIEKQRTGVIVRPFKARRVIMVLTPGRVLSLLKSRGLAKGITDRQARDIAISVARDMRNMLRSTDAAPIQSRILDIVGNEIDARRTIASRRGNTVRTPAEALEASERERKVTENKRATIENKRKIAEDSRAIRRAEAEIAKLNEKSRTDAIIGDAKKQAEAIKNEAYAEARDIVKKAKAKADDIELDAKLAKRAVKTAQDWRIAHRLELENAAISGFDGNGPARHKDAADLVSRVRDCNHDLELKNAGLCDKVADVIPDVSNAVDLVNLCLVHSVILKSLDSKPRPESVSFVWSDQAAVGVALLDGKRRPVVTVMPDGTLRVTDGKGLTVRALVAQNKAIATFLDAFPPFYKDFADEVEAAVSKFEAVHGTDGERSGETDGEGPAATEDKD